MSLGRLLAWGVFIEWPNGKNGGKALLVGSINRKWFHPLRLLCLRRLYMAKRTILKRN